MLSYFHEIKSDKINNHIIIVDIDGTITNQGNFEIEQKVVNKIIDLKKTNSLYLCSNNKNKQRNLRIANRLSVPLINCNYKKPSKHILNSILNIESSPILVIGDCFLTDIRFANKIQCGYIRTKRVISPFDSIFIRSFYLFDDLVFFFNRLIKK